MNCSVCSNKIERNCNTKIKCNDCNHFFHFGCVNITEDDANFFKSSAQPFRCDKCAVLRRRSLQYLPVPPVLPQQQSINAVNSNTHSTVKESTVNQDSEGQCTLQMVYAKLSALEETNKQFLLQLNLLRTENADLKSRVNVLESKLNWQQQNLLSNDIEITGVCNANDSNCIRMAQQIFSRALSVDVPDIDIEKCYVRKTKANSSSTALKSIICLRFSNLTTKQRIMCAKRKNKNNLNTYAAGIDEHVDKGAGGSSNNSSSNSKKSKGTGIYINDSLTKFTQALLMKTKEAMKRTGGKYVWFNNNQILIRKVVGGKVISIRSFNDLTLI